MNDVIVAWISVAGSILVSLVSLAGVIYTGKKNGNEMSKQFEIQQAVTDTKIDELTREVREHNKFARRMPVLEEQMKVANHRIKDLEEATKHE